MSKPIARLKPVALYDACVLYPAALRDTLMSLAVTGLFRARWTEAIHDEWTRNLREDRPDLPPAQLERTRRLMNKAVPDAVVTGYEGRIETLTLPDPDDRHVLAAAIHAKAQVIITFNLRDFPSAVLSAYGLRAEPPDAFLSALLRDHPQEVTAALARQRHRLINPPQSVEEFLANLARQGLAQTAEDLRPHAALL